MSFDTEKGVTSLSFLIAIRLLEKDLESARRSGNEKRQIRLEQAVREVRQLSEKVCAGDLCAGVPGTKSIELGVSVGNTVGYLIATKALDSLELTALETVTFYARQCCGRPVLPLFQDLLASGKEKPTPVKVVRIFHIPSQN